MRKLSKFDCHMQGHTSCSQVDDLHKDPNGFIEKDCPICGRSMKCRVSRADDWLHLVWPKHKRPLLEDEASKEA